MSAYRSIAAIAISALVVAQVGTQIRLAGMSKTISDLRLTTACLELGYKVEQKVNPKPGDLNRVCTIDGRPWISWSNIR